MSHTFQAQKQVNSMIEDLSVGASEPALIEFIFGSNPIIYAEQSASFEDLVAQLDGAFEAHDSETIVLGVRMNVIDNLIGIAVSIIPGMSPRSAGLRSVYGALSQLGLHIVDEVACLPSLDNPRFLFPVADHLSQMMLLRSFLLPRRYSLGLWQRVLLRTYVAVSDILGSPKFLHRGLFLQVRKC